MTTKIPNDLLKNAPLFSQEIISGTLAYAENTTVNFAHGFGVKPKIVQVSLICTTAWGGYVVGDEVQYLDVAYVGSAYHGGSVVFDDVNITVLTVQQCVGVSRSSGVQSSLPPENFGLKIRAWA
jgi:hypothetical protein